MDPGSFILLLKNQHCWWKSTFQQATKIKCATCLRLNIPGNIWIILMWLKHRKSYILYLEVLLTCTSLPSSTVCVCVCVCVCACVCVRAVSQPSLTGHPSGRERLGFWEVTACHVSMTHGDPSTHRPPGSSSISQSHGHVFPSGRNADTLTLGRTKVYTRAAFFLFSGFSFCASLFPRIPKPDGWFAVTFWAVTWRKITETKYKCDAFMRADGARTNPQRYNAICVIGCNGAG